MKNKIEIILMVSLLCLSGCMFNVVHVKQVPTTFNARVDQPQTFVLTTSHSISIGTGFPIRLKANTRWTKIGSIVEGDIYSTDDQILTVEASHIHEADLVVKEGSVVGFFLVVEKTFCPVKKPIKIK